MSAFSRSLRSLLPNRQDYRHLRQNWRGDLLAGVTVGIGELPHALPLPTLPLIEAGTLPRLLGPAFAVAALASIASGFFGGIAVAVFFARRALSTASGGVHREELHGSPVAGDERIALFHIDSLRHQNHLFTELEPAIAHARSHISRTPVAST